MIQKSTSPYASPEVLVKKKNGSNRIFVDYRKLNRVTATDTAPITPMENLMQELSGDRYFTRMKLSKRYWEIPVVKHDVEESVCDSGRTLRVSTNALGIKESVATLRRVWTSYKSIAQTQTTT